MKVTHISIVGYGVYNYPEGMNGWQFVRFEYLSDTTPYTAMECHVWLPPDTNTCKLEDLLNEGI